MKYRYVATGKKHKVIIDDGEKPVEKACKSAKEALALRDRAAMGRWNGFPGTKPAAKPKSPTKRARKAA